jgi:hypothetical protein
MKTYKALLFAPYGEFVSDFRDSKTILDVWEKIGNMGSRWIFYPIPLVATNKTIVAAPEGLEHLVGKRIATVKKWFEQKYEENGAGDICEAINEGEIPMCYTY